MCYKLHILHQRVFSHLFFAVQTRELPTSPECACLVVIEQNASSHGRES